MDSESYRIGLDGLILVASIACGIVGTVFMFRERRVGDGLFALFMYFGLPTILYSSIEPLTERIGRCVPGTAAAPELLRFAALFLLSPALLVWCVWLLVGGFAVLGGNVNLRDLLRAHATRQAMRNKIKGIAVMLAAVLGIWAAVVFTSSWILFAALWVGALGYFRGAIYLVFPENQSFRP